MAVTKADIQQLLKDRGWSQKDLTRRMGLSSGTINHWTTGKRTPSGLYEQELLRLIAETAVITAHSSPEASGQELRDMITRIVAATTTPEDTIDDPIVRAYQQGRRETATEVLTAVLDALLASAQRGPTQSAYAKGKTKHVRD